MKRIVVLASGSGSNAENIYHFFSKGDFAKVVAVLSNKKSAKVLERADRLGIPAFYFNKTAFCSEEGAIKLIRALSPDLVVLAGFLWKIPEFFIKSFPNQIINIHPALLPKYGGKGMYGSNVHKAVKENQEVESGITIHYVNENYDEGAIIHQSKTTLLPADDVHEIAQKVHLLEYEHYPKVIEHVLKQQNGSQ
ncbi:phosphoribosylglycinamide formyltransferase [Flagellimonas allohymeniacidonis]|uniref:Phosphoribosylglycinamide formyltransferase n=1 Tax=Flagellimonas allohymeniacidonis TaxID=2517819 RepID=A0A4Q8QGI4_9FLAO|nr:phosphoribosylglycinamide formyltransferase [Allomuricauda hymeniacidonis]TAI47703.1 phosphoribosylglycinamide formyltransferase [Allomuricauda hymeniacidonis]